MSLNSVQMYVKSLLNGLALPYTSEGTLSAYISYPLPVDEASPICFIWGADIDEHRQTAPRAQPGQPSTGGFKDVVYLLDVWLMHAELNDDPNADSMFPVVIDTIAKTLRNTQLGVQLTDSVTGDVSTIKAIGEDIKTQYEGARTMEDERMLQYMARLQVKIVEKVQA